MSIRHILVTLALVLGWPVQPVFATQLSEQQIQACLQTNLVNVLSGREPVSKYVDFKVVTQRVFRAASRQLDEAGKRVAARALADHMQTSVNTHRHRFQNARIEVTYVKPSSRTADVYGVEGVIHKNGQYDFTVHGYFYSPTSCSLYGIAIAGALPMVRYLQDQPEVMALCQELTKQRC